VSTSASEYIPPLCYGRCKNLYTKRRPGIRSDPIISVAAGADNPQPDHRHPSDRQAASRWCRCPPIVAWSQDASPAASRWLGRRRPRPSARRISMHSFRSCGSRLTRNKPSTERKRLGSLSQQVVAPAQDVNVESSVRNAQARQAAEVRQWSHPTPPSGLRREP